MLADNDKLIEKNPINYGQIGVQYQKRIYEQFENNNDLFSFVPKAYIINKTKGNFIP